MGFFNLFKKQKELKGINDGNDEGTDGIITENDIESEEIPDDENGENIGNFGKNIGNFGKTKIQQTVTPNIPRVRLSATPDQRLQKSKSLLYRNNTVSSFGNIKPSEAFSNQKIGDDETSKFKGLTEPLNAKEEGMGSSLSFKDKINQRKNPFASDEENKQNSLSYLFGNGIEENLINGLLAKASAGADAGKDSSSVDSKGNPVDFNGASDVPNLPQYDKEPDGSETVTKKIKTKEGNEVFEKKGAYDSPKWKDILVGALSNLSRLDLSRVPPEQRTGAFLGALLGGTVQGAGTKDFAGQIALENDKSKVRADNQLKKKDYEENLTLINKRTEARNRQLEPLFKQQEAERKALADENRNLIAKGKLTQEEAKNKELAKDREFKNQIALAKNKQAQDKLDSYLNAGWTKVYKDDGTVGIVSRSGQEIPITSLDGRGEIRAIDPNQWRYTQAQIEANQNEEVGKIPVKSAQDQASDIEGIAIRMADGLQNWDALSPKKKNELRKSAESIYQRQQAETRKSAEAKAKASGAKRVLQNRNQPNRPKRRSFVTPRVRQSDNIDYSLSFSKAKKD